MAEYNIKKVGKNFRIYGDFIEGVPYGSGHINDTFAVSYNQAGDKMRYIFQRINHNIFKNPEALMENIDRVTRHQQKKLEEHSSNVSRQTLSLVPSSDGKPFSIDTDGNYWRVYLFIENAETYDIIENEEQAFQAAKAFGKFQEELVDIPGDRLNETIPDFHNTSKRYEALEEAIEADEFNRVKSAVKEIKFALERKADAAILLDLSKEGKIPERITHNDTKLNNVMIDDKTGEGICVIDLDTVMPGLVLYDFGDLVRTSTSPAAEDERDLSKVKMQINMFEALLKGYMSTAGGFLNQTEKEYLPFGGKLITLEIGVRFLTDYLSGDAYFKTHRDGQNLDRCRTQFKLVSSIEEQMNEMNNLVKEYC
ncbi:MAG: aminoglycoside phosphotransferase family protein [Verrucomicrobiota bacterium]|nr:aminoglycoside phosphotransferase family protein [Verrucomicrobiota bacterium]